MYEIDEEREEREVQQQYEALIAACNAVKPLTGNESSEIFRAFALAKKAHSGIRRKSGELYIFHPLSVALIAVQEIGLGPVAVICALLHDVVEDTDTSLESIRTIFGDRVATIVDGVTKVGDMLEMQPNSSKQAENYRKILLSMCGDVYVIFLKLCDRLHNMRTLESMKDVKKQVISSETAYFYIPLAHRLGLYNIKTELEELVMKYNNPVKYNEIYAKLNANTATVNQLKEVFTKPIREMLDAHGFKYTIKTRIKSVYSCWKKMQNKGVAFDEIYDLYAMRIILDTPLESEKEDCFRVYSLVTSKFSPNPSRFRDWITNPKNNGYESLQTTVMSPIGRWVELQIRTTRMDDVAEKGMAAHFLYKEAHPDAHLENNPMEEWLQQIRSTLENTEHSALDLVEEFKESLYTTEIYLFTPKGETIVLPAHSTVLDFAFAIHTDLGLHCIGAKVNSRVVPNQYKLLSGQQVQILTGQKTVPTDDWIDHAHTARAKSRIKDFLHEQHKAYRETGEHRLQEIFTKYGIAPSEDNLPKLKHFFDINSSVEFFYQLAIGKIAEADIARCFDKYKQAPRMFFLEPFRRLFESEEEHGVVTSPSAPSLPFESRYANTTFLLDADYQKFSVETASCCKPVQGDGVIGIVTDGKIMIHRTNCKVAIHEMASHENHIVRAKWHRGEGVSFLTGISLSGIDRKGLLQELTLLISQEMDLNMRSISLEVSEGVIRGIIMLYVDNLDILNTLMENIRKIDCIEDVRRMDR